MRTAATTLVSAIIRSDGEVEATGDDDDRLSGGGQESQRQDGDREAPHPGHAVVRLDELGEHEEPRARRPGRLGVRPFRRLSERRRRRAACRAASRGRRGGPSFAIPARSGSLGRVRRSSLTASAAPASAASAAATSSAATSSGIAACDLRLAAARGGATAHRPLARARRSRRRHGHRRSRWPGRGRAPDIRELRRGPGARQRLQPGPQAAVIRCLVPSRAAQSGSGAEQECPDAARDQRAIVTFCWLPPQSRRTSPPRPGVDLGARPPPRRPLTALTRQNRSGPSAVCGAVEEEARYSRGPERCIKEASARSTQRQGAQAPSWMASAGWLNETAVPSTRSSPPQGVRPARTSKSSSWPWPSEATTPGTSPG